MARPKKNPLMNKELERAEEQFQKFEESVKEMTLDRMNAAPKEEQEPQTKLSSKEIDKSKDIYLKPIKSFGPGVDPKTGRREVFNERFRDEYNFAKEYVQFVAENKEIIGERIDIWTKKFPGTDCEYWEVPVNKPIWGPRYLAEQIKRKSYHRLRMMDDKIVSSDGMGSYFGSMTVDTTVQRLDAVPVSDRKSIFMGASSF